MKTAKKIDYFLGLDIGTDSIGYAVTDTSYHLCKFQQHPMWGVHLFDPAETAAPRRMFRTARRRLDRRQQRIRLLQEIFAHEIAKKDQNFYRRISESALIREDANEAYSFFADKDYTDIDYHKQYPTIHHLIWELMENTEPHDVRLVYLACAWLLAHRGHFLSDASKDSAEAMSFASAYKNLQDNLENIGQKMPWDGIVTAGEIEKTLHESKGITGKKENLGKLLYSGEKVPKIADTDSEFPYSPESFIKLLSGTNAKASALFGEESYEGLDIKLTDDDVKMQEVISQLNDEHSSLILCMKQLYDCILLKDILGDHLWISEAKIAQYEQHKSDLKTLKYFIKKYGIDQNQDKYYKIFRDKDEGNYVSYIGHSDSLTREESASLKSVNQEDFCKYIMKNLDFRSSLNEEDLPRYDAMMDSVKDLSFMPKQVNSDNRTIPYQLYYRELKKLLENAKRYLPFLSETDADGYRNIDKILSIMKFRIPYFVGPLNANSKLAWIKRKALGKIYPWNFDRMVDFDACEQEFINRMTNQCTYLPNLDVLPKCSPLYEKFEVLNLINNICILGKKISVDCKQHLFNALFMKRKKVTKKAVHEFLKSNGYITHETLEDISGIDTEITASLSTRISFRELVSAGKLSEEDIEEIVAYGSCSQDKNRFVSFLEKYPSLSEQERRYVSGLKIQEFGRLSKYFLTQLRQQDEHTGASKNIIELLWETNNNLQQLLSDEFSFTKQISEYRKTYYDSNPKSINERLDDMYVSNSVKRPIIRTLTITGEIIETMGCLPKKVFVEMARDASNEKKGKKTKSRYEQLKEFYQTVKDDAVPNIKRELENLGERDNKLQSDAIFLYFMQLGKSMYTGKPIDLSKIKGSDAQYNIEHIYPRSKVKDDSILNNCVLVESSINGQKSDSFPISQDIRSKMLPFWQRLLEYKMITQEKYSRLTRDTPFSPDEEFGFINRQLVETRQSTKIVAELLKEILGSECEIVYVKAPLVSDFRKEFDMLKSRTMNDLHHAKDAYLNVVVGNVYHEKFTKQFFFEKKEDYSIKTKTLFTKPIWNHRELLWNGTEDLVLVKKNMMKNYIHYTRYAFCKHGGLFDQNLISAVKGENLYSPKKGKKAIQYGGYDNVQGAFFILVRYDVGKKCKQIIFPVRIVDQEQYTINPEKWVEEFLLSSEKATNINFPVGTSPLKINTIFEVNNSYRFTLAARTGSNIVFSPYTPLLLDNSWEAYIKHLESFDEKVNNNSNLRYNADFYKFDEKRNVELYELLCMKMSEKPLSLRPAISSVSEKLRNSKDVFVKLDIVKQVKVLLKIISLFSPNGRGGADLSLLNLGSQSAPSRLSNNIFNWKFTSVRIINTDSSGLHESKSCELMTVTTQKK